MIHLFWEPCAKARPMVILNDEWCQRILTFWIPLWQFQVFVDQGSRLLQKQGGGCRYECDAWHHGRFGHHIPGAQNTGMFLKQELRVSGDTFWNNLYRGAGSKKDWLFLKLELDDFTSGFRTNCADMAGGWEEVGWAKSGTCLWYRTRQARWNGRDCYSASKQNVAGPWNNFDFEFSQ